MRTAKRGAGSGCGAILSALIAAVAVIGYVSWSNDSCTVYVDGQQANLTLQGWGANNDCSQLVNTGANRLLSLVSLGLLGSHEAPAGGDLICSGFVGLIHYSIRDTSITGTYLFGRSLCNSFQQAGQATPMPTG